MHKLPRLLAFGLCFLVGTAALAQQTYRCGSTYSQTPCDKSAEPAKMFKDARAAAAPGLKGKELCKQMVPRLAHLGDPYSAVIDEVDDARHDVVKIGTELVEARRFDVAMNSKNGYGAYAGSKLYQCFLSVDETRLLKVHSPAQ